MKPIKFFWGFSVATLLVCGVVFMQQRQTLASLKKQESTQTPLLREKDRLQKENKDFSARNLQSRKKEIAQLSEQTKDLHTLRGEIPLLRQEAKKAAELEARIAQLPEATPGEKTGRGTPVRLDMELSLERVINRGQGSPEHTVETFLWAAREQRADILLQCLDFPEQDPEIEKQLAASLGQSLKKAQAELESIRIVSSTALGGGKVELEVISKDGPEKMVFVQKGVKWKMDINQSGRRE